MVNGGNCERVFRGLKNGYTVNLLLICQPTKTASESALELDLAPGRARTCNPMIRSHVVENQRTRADVTGIRREGQLSGSQRRLRK
jgi:hypothetical protein